MPLQCRYPIFLPLLHKDHAASIFHFEIFLHFITFPEQFQGLHDSSQGTQGVHQSSADFLGQGLILLLGNREPLLSFLPALTPYIRDGIQILA